MDWVSVMRRVINTTPWRRTADTYVATREAATTLLCAARRDTCVE